MTAVYHSTHPPISAMVENHEITFTEESIREVFRFGDTVIDPTAYHPYLLRGCFKRMGYRGRFHNSQLRKTDFSPQW